jgi:flavin reductase (DIM6/NTAB) family NADH-FMN oxidoreductase RutF
LWLKNHLRKLIKGLTIPQEYCCLAMEGLQYPLRTFLTLENKTFQREVTHSHLFLGYKPLIIGVPILVESKDYQILRKKEEVCLYFIHNKSGTDLGANEFPTNQTSVAKLILMKREERQLHEYSLFVYEGVSGSHTFLNKGHQLVNSLLQKFQRRQVTNLNLQGNLWDQVRIAYSIPRRISIVTVSDGTLINMFPTDLHGSIGKNYYASSLRIGGKANEQVEKYRRIVISTVDVSAYQQSYFLGKNHMADLQEAESFSIHEERSSVFNSPLPGSVASYHELVLAESFDFGIHRIHIYKVVHPAEVRSNCKTLGHIHQYYAQWRINHQLETQLFFR